MLSRILLVVAMSMGAAACVGDVDDGTTDPTNTDNPTQTDKKAIAKAEFESKVYPIIETKCGGCHKATTNPIFVGATKDTAHAQIMGYTQLVGGFTPDSAGVSNIPVRTAHNGITYTSEERTAINKWLSLQADAEVTTPGNTPPGEEKPGEASARLMKEFQKCMPTAAFNTLQVANRVANWQSNNGVCSKCHRQGTGGFMATEVSATLLTHLKNPANDPAIGTFWMVQFYSPQVATKPWAMTVNTAGFQRAATGQGPLANHPQFALTGPAMTAITAYFDEVKKGLDEKGNCKTPAQ